MWWNSIHPGHLNDHFGEPFPTVCNWPATADHGLARKQSVSAPLHRCYDPGVAVYNPQLMSGLESEADTVDRSNRLFVRERRCKFPAQILQVAVDGPFRDIKIVLVERVEQL